MSDTPQAQAPQADAEATAQEATPAPAAPTPAVEPSNSVERVDQLPKWAQDLIRDLRRESAAYRAAKQQRDHEAETTAAQLRTQLEEIMPKYNDLSTRYNTLRAELALARAGAIDPDVLAPRLPAEVLDDQDKLAQAIAQLRQAKPHQFRAGSADGGARSSSGASVGTGMQRLRHAIAQASTTNGR